MELSLKERLERLGPTRDVDRVSSGSPALFVLRLKRNQATPKTVDAALALAKRGISLSRAKKATEKLLSAGRVFVQLPTVEDPETLANELANANIAAASVEVETRPDIRALRSRLNLTREQFAITYGFDVETLRNWEVGRREPDLAARSYLRAIENDPEKVEQAYAPTPGL